MRLFALVLIMFFAFRQQSQPPTPTPTPPPSAHANQKKPRPEQQQTRPDDQTTENLTTAIQQLTAEIAAYNQQQSGTPYKDESSAKWWSIGNSLLITLFTAVLAIVAVLQWKAMRRQADIADTQANISKEQLAITKAAEALHKEEKWTEVTEGIRERRRSDERYTEQLELAKDNAATAKQSADAAQVSAKLAKDALRLQELSEKQWINLENWSARAAHSPSQPPLLMISFQVVNPTRTPLTIHLIQVKIIDGKESNESTVNVLAPNNPYVVTVSHELSETEWTNYRAAQTMIGLDCKILFADCFGIHWEQQFERILGSSATGVSVMVIRNHLRGSPGETGSRDVEFPS
jgi:hypothetical protein